MDGSEPATRFRARDHFFVSSFWLAYNFQWGAMLAIVLPSQIAALVGDERKEFFNGLIPALGALLSLVLTPVAGALSDRSASRWGRRRPFLAVGTAINLAFVLALAGFGAGANVWLFLLVYLGIQFGSNWAGGPYAGLIPDVVPFSARGVASGWLALMTAVGILAGALAAGALVHGTHYGAIYRAIALVLVAVLAVTCLGVRERPQTRGAADAAGSWRETIAGFIPRGPAYRNFFYVLLTRALVTMGIYSVFTFFQFFLQDVIRVPNPVAQSSYLVAIIIGAGIPTSLIAGALSDRVGRKPLVYASGGLMAVASALLIFVAFAPSLGWVFAVGALFGIGYGAYQAVDWALAVDVLPKGESAAKDMGIWHVSLVLPQVLAPAATGMTLSAFRSTSLLAGYTTVFILTAVWFVLGTVYVRRIRGVR